MKENSISHSVKLEKVESEQVSLNIFIHGSSITWV